MTTLRTLACIPNKTAHLNGACQTERRLSSFRSLAPPQRVFAHVNETPCFSGCLLTCGNGLVSGDAVVSLLSRRISNGVTTSILSILMLRKCDDSKNVNAQRLRPGAVWLVGFAPFCCLFPRRLQQPLRPSDIILFHSTVVELSDSQSRHLIQGLT